MTNCLEGSYSIQLSYAPWVTSADLTECMILHHVSHCIRADPYEASFNPKNEVVKRCKELDGQCKLKQREQHNR